MKIARISHACLLVKTPKVTCIMDPVFEDVFEGGANVFDPPVNFDKKKIGATSFDVVIISHQHFDHFSVKTLDSFSRDVLMVFPARATLIKTALEKMGFTNLSPVESFDDGLKIGDLALHFTRSAVDDTEMGVLFVSNNRSCWNQVDSIINLDIIRETKRFAKNIDIFLAWWQPIVESEVSVDTMGSPFPLKSYNSILNNIREIQPNCVVPTSCNVKCPHPDQNWVNERMFPLSEGEFVQDLKSIYGNKLKVISMAPGDEMTCHPPYSVRKSAVKFVQNKSKRGSASYEFRPGYYLPKPQDFNIPSYSPSSLRKEVHKFLHGPVLDTLRSKEFAFSRSRLKRMDAVWQLEVVYPSGPPEIRHIDFGAERLVWKERHFRRPPKLNTSIAASAIVGALKGDLTNYGITCGGMIRNTRKLYEVNEGGASEMRFAFQDPLSYVLLRNIDEKYVENQLRKLGY